MEPVGRQGRTGRQQGFDFPGQFRRHHLVGIDVQDPVVFGAIFGITLLRPITRPVMMDDARPQAFGDGHGIVGRAAVDHDDVIGYACDCTNTIADPKRFVLRNDAAAQTGYRCVHDGAFVPNAS